jgi:hypothetical protein
MNWRNVGVKPPDNWDDIIVRDIKTKQVIDPIWNHYDDHLVTMQRGNAYNGDTYHYHELEWLDESDNHEVSEEKQVLIDNVIEDLKVNSFAYNDYTVLEELLSFIPDKYLEGALTEE